MIFWVPFGKNAFEVQGPAMDGSVIFRKPPSIVVHPFRKQLRLHLKNHKAIRLIK